MKILIVMTGFFPGQKFGGPPVSVDNFCSLMKEHDCYIVTRNHDMGDTEVYSTIKEGWNDRGNCKVLYLSDREYGYKRYEKVVNEIKPDLIYLQGMFQNCIIPCLMIAKKHRINVLLAPRGELCAGAFKKKYKKVPYIIFLKLFGLINNIHYQSTSEEESEAISRILKVPVDRIHLLSNIPSIPRENYSHIEKKSGSANLVFLSRIVAKKNLHYAIERLKHISGNVNLDIYGIKEDEDYWKQCQNLINALPSNISVTFRGSIPHDEVHKTLSKYDAFLFPTLSENFGHVIVEALAVGCPVIISDQVPWIDVEKYNAGWALPLDKPEKFEAAIQNIVEIDNIAENKMRVGSQNYFNQKLQISKLRQSYQRVLIGDL